MTAWERILEYLEKQQAEREWAWRWAKAHENDKHHRRPME